MSFNITIEEDSIIDGTQTITVTATATNWATATDTIAVGDNEQQVLSLSIPSSASEEDGSVQGTVSIQGTYDSDLIVSLNSSDTSEVTVPSAVILPTGETSANFDLTIVEDSISDDTQIVSLTASSSGWASADSSITIMDRGDTDKDALPDWWETEYFGDLSQDGTGDYDGDDVSNLDEFLTGRNPNNHEPDTPILSSPANGATGVSLTPTLNINSFKDTDGHNHDTTEWQISTDKDDFTDDMLVFKVDSDIALTSLSVASYVLDENTSYFWRARVRDDGDAVSEWPAPFEFATGTSGVTDTNGNGIPDSQDLGPAESDLDLDGNGVPDVNEPSDSWKCLNTAAGDGHVGVKIPPGNTIKFAESIDPQWISDTTNRPDIMPHALINFSLTVPNEGDSSEITVYLSGTLPANSKWYTWNAADGWQEVPATFSQTGNGDTKVVFTKTDGGTGDADGLANSVIVDPSGPGAADPKDPNGGGGGGCFITAAKNEPDKP